jgi:hypothetical protein
MLPANPIPKRRQWLRRPTLVAAWAVLLIALVHPPHGLGLPICWMAAATGVPCPGCGLTRSMSCAIRGMLRASWHYHPFGFVFLALFAGIAVISLFPARIRERLDAWIERHVRAMNIAYGVLIAAFLMFGAARAVVHCLHP